MSGNGDDEKPEAGKTFPLDLAAKMTTVKAMDGKASIVMAGQPLRSRVLTQPSTLSTAQTSVVTPAIINTNLVPQAVIKQCEANRSQVAGIISASQPQSQGTTSITLQRPAQITLATTLPIVATTLPVVTQSTYHVPRGPAVVANLAAPRSNVTAAAIRTPMVVTAQANVQQAFVRPPRTPSPAQGTAWLTTNSSNSSQIKGTPTVLSSSVRGASVTGTLGKPQLLTKTQSASQTVPPIRPTTATILHSAITIGGQGAQIHPFKPGQGTANIQALGSAVTLAHVLPSRTQTLVYSTGGNGTQFSATPRLAAASAAQNQRQASTPKPVAQVATARLTVPISVTQAGTARLVAPQGTVLTTGARISTPQQPAIIGTTPARIVTTTQPNAILGRLSVSITTSPVQVSSTNVLSQTRSALPLHSFVAVANSPQPRGIQTQGAKVITQPVQGNTIHIPQMPATVMKTAPTVTTTARTINIQPANLVTQRPITTGSSQTVSISKVFSQQVDSPQVQSTQPTANIFIHAPIASVPRKAASPGPAVATQTPTTIPTTSVSTYSLASGTYFYDASGTYSVARSFNQQSSFAAVPQSNNQQLRPATLTTQVHGIVANQQMRFNPVMVVEQNRVQQFAQQSQPQQPEASQELPQQITAPISKVTSSPRPSILRKRDHEGSPMKAAKNLAPQLGIVPIQPQAPISPPSRPDSGENCHSSGSTTISATSSPGLAEVNEDSMQNVLVHIKEEEENARPPPEMSPRKKPRKQQLTGNDLDENIHEDMQFISETNIKKAPEPDNVRSDVREEHSESRRVLRKPASASLLNSYRQTWKATHNHYQKYGDVRPKDERRPTIMDLSNQYRVLDKVNGWKIHHLSTQMEDLADQEQNVYNQLTDLLKDTEAQEGNGFDKDLNRINELIKGNMQRIKIINDGMIEAKTQIMKIFDHKIHVTDIISRCASKRNFKKREKS